MPTTDERRQVAARLRHIAEHGAPEWATSACCIAECLGEDDYPLWNGSEKLFARLADLIEPEERMCRNEATGSDFKCSECGCSVVGSAYWTEANICNGDWNYCPNCEAKVVEQ